MDFRSHSPPPPELLNDRSGVDKKLQEVSILTERVGYFHTFSLISLQEASMVEKKTV